MTHAYGEAADLALEYLQTIDEYLPQTYLEARHTLNHDVNQFYKPEMEEKLLAVDGITRQYEEKLAPYKNMPMRVQTVSVRLLLRHCELCRGLAKAMALKCVGKDVEAKAAIGEFMKEFGKYEQSMERYYDHRQHVSAYHAIFGKMSEYVQ